MEKEKCTQKILNRTELCRKRMLRLCLFVAAAGIFASGILLMTLFGRGPFLTASAIAGVEDAILGMVKVVKALCVCVGTVIILFGIIQALIAHAAGNGSSLNSSYVSFGVGVTLLVLGLTKLLDNIDWSGIVNKISL